MLWEAWFRYFGGHHQSSCRDIESPHWIFRQDMSSRCIDLCCHIHNLDDTTCNPSPKTKVQLNPRSPCVRYSQNLSCHSQSWSRGEMGIWVTGRAACAHHWLSHIPEFKRQRRPFAGWEGWSGSDAPRGLFAQVQMPSSARSQLAPSNTNLQQQHPTKRPTSTLPRSSPNQSPYIPIQYCWLTILILMVTPRWSSQ